MLARDQRAQVSFEYLLTVTIGVILVIAATTLALQLVSIADVTTTKILEKRAETILSLLGG